MKINKTLTMGLILLGLNFNIQVNAAEHNVMEVYKSPYCGCCTGWASEMSKAGFLVKTINMDDLSEIKKQSSVTEELAGCHTAILGDYILEGHVPLEAVKKLMSEKPNIRGLSTPGMPFGSLGMGYDPDAKYDVFAFSADITQKPTIFYQVGN